MDFTPSPSPSFAGHITAGLRMMVCAVHAVLGIGRIEQAIDDAIHRWMMRIFERLNTLLAAYRAGELSPVIERPMTPTRDVPSLPASRARGGATAWPVARDMREPGCADEAVVVATAVVIKAARIFRMVLDGGAQVVARADVLAVGRPRFVKNGVRLAGESCDLIVPVCD